MSILSHAIQIDNADYHAGDRLSWSKFKRFLQSPLAFKHAMDNPQPATPAMEFGSLAHCLAFEPELFGRDYVVYAKLDGRTAAGKAQKAALEADPRTAVSEEDHERAKAVAEACKRHLPAVTAQAEAAFYASVAGVSVQCKCDLITAEGQIYDLKTCASLERCISGLEFGDWLLGDAWYRMVIRAATGELPPPVQYIVVETAAPHDSVARYYEAGLYDLCDIYLRKKLGEYNACMDSGKWPGIDADPVPKPIDVKPFAVAKLQDEVLDSEEYIDILMEQTEGGI